MPGMYGCVLDGRPGGPGCTRLALATTRTSHAGTRRVWRACRTASSHQPRFPPYCGQTAKMKVFPILRRACASGTKFPFRHGRAMVVWPVSRLAQSLYCVRLDKVVDVTVARSGRWVWWGRGVFGVIVVGLVVYLGVVGLDQADKWGSSIGCVIALVALVTPYLLPRHVREGTMSESAATDGVVVENSGDAEAEQGGEATT